MRVNFKLLFFPGTVEHSGFLEVGKEHSSNYKNIIVTEFSKFSENIQGELN